MSAEQPKSVDAPFYAIVEPVWGRGSDRSGRPILDGAKVVRLTQNPPGAVRNGGIVTRLTLRIDADALLPLQPSAVIHVSAADVDVIEVEAESPRDEPDA